MATFASLSNLGEACRAAEEFIQSMRSIPDDYIRAFETPLVRHYNYMHCGIFLQSKQSCMKYVASAIFSRASSAKRSAMSHTRDYDKPCHP